MTIVEELEHLRLKCIDYGAELVKLREENKQLAQTAAFNLERSNTFHDRAVAAEKRLAELSAEEDTLA